MEDTDVLSFTVDDADNVLELTRTDYEGELYYRENNGWILLTANDDYPTIYEQRMFDVTPEERENALEFWDSAQTTDTPLTRDSVLSFIALVH